MRNLKEIIRQAMMFTGLKSLPDYLLAELKDYFAHEILRLQRDLMKEDHNHIYLEHAEQILNRFFARCFGVVKTDGESTASAIMNRGEE